MDENGRPSQLPQALRQDHVGFEKRRLRAQDRQQLQCELICWEQVLRFIDD